MNKIAHHLTDMDVISHKVSSHALFNNFDKNLLRT